MDETTDLSEEQLRLLREVDAQGRLSIQDVEDPKGEALRRLEAAGYVRGLPLRTTGACCIFVLTGQGVIAAGGEGPSSRGAWEA